MQRRMSQRHTVLAIQLAQQLPHGLLDQRQPVRLLHETGQVKMNDQVGGRPFVVIHLTGLEAHPHQADGQGSVALTKFRVHRSGLASLWQWVHVIGRHGQRVLSHRRDSARIDGSAIVSGCPRTTTCRGLRAATLTFAIRFHHASIAPPPSFTQAPLALGPTARRVKGLGVWYAVPLQECCMQRVCLFGLLLIAGGPLSCVDDGKHQCAADADCLNGRVCMGGTCSDPAASGSSSGSSSSSSSAASSASASSSGAASSTSGSSGGDTYELAQWPLPPLHPTGYTADADTVLDNVTGLRWQRVAPTTEYYWDDAKLYCASLSLGGAEEWVLPTLIEMLTLVDFTKYGPAIDDVAFPDSRDSFWTASGYNSKRYVSFNSGDVSFDSPQSLTLRVRCVLHPALLQTPRYSVDGAAGSVTDTRTGLTWQRSEVAGTYMFADAPSACTNGWRLPNIRELASIVDVRQDNPATDPQAFNDAPLRDTWSATPYANGASYGWGVYFVSGLTWTQTVDSSFHVRCVR